MTDKKAPSGAPKVYPEWVTTPSEQKLYDDFRVFLFLILKHLRKDCTKRQYRVAQWLQHGPRRRMVQGFRGLGKSWITSAYVLWRLYRDSQERIMVVSANEQRAIEFATFTRRLINEIELLHFLRPRDGQRDSVLAFDVGPSDAHQAPSVRAVGIFGQLAGGRATVIVADDVEVPRNSLTEVMREKLAEAIKEFDAVLVPGGEIVYLGTPQTEQSVYRLLPSRGYSIRVWPARYPSPEQAAKYGDSLAPDILEDILEDASVVGHSTDPERFSDLDLAEREASYGRSGFALQFMLDTSLSDAERFPLRTSDLLCMDIDLELAPSKLVWTSAPEKAVTDIDNLGFTGDRLYRPMYISEVLQPYQGKLLAIDPSGRGKDETSYVVLYQMAGMLFLVETGGFTDGYTEGTLDGLAEIAKRHKVNTVLVESNMGDGMFSALLAPVLTKVHPCTMEEVRSTVQKERRIIEDLEPILNQHRLAIDAKAAKKDAQAGVMSLLYQLTHITKDRGALRHDDRLDILAHAVRFFRDRLQRDAQSAEAEYLEAARTKQLEEFRSKWFKSKAPRSNFMQTNAGFRNR